MATTNIAIGYHQQDTSYYCGAACAQMILDQIGMGLLDQDALYNDNHSHSTTEPNWATAPDGLLWTLTHRQTKQPYALHALNSEDAISRMICWTIERQRVGSPALVYGWQHWILVRGYDASAAPTGSTDNQYSIDGFYINNPWPPVPKSPPVGVPPHSNNDGCGAGGNRGLLNEHISYSTWVEDYMTGVPRGHWAGKFVALGSPDPTALLPGVRSIFREESVGVPLMGGKQLAGAAVNSLRSLAASQKIMDIRPPETAKSGLLVQRLDRLDEYYYIVPVDGNRETATRAVSVDAKTGAYRQSIALPSSPERSMWDFSRQEALEQITKQRLELPGQAGRLMVRPDTVQPSPHLVWKPCRESLSPFFPFHMFTVGGHTAYMRLDGAVFTELHVDGRGL